jgi:hypothetical protein
MARPSTILELRPPWILYPGGLPFSGQYRQGNGEFYVHHVWLPFWRTLSAALKEEYLRHWNASEEWHAYCQRWSEEE